MSETTLTAADPASTPQTSVETPSQPTRRTIWPTVRVIIEAIVVFAVLLTLYLPYATQYTFLDEFDNMVGGKVVADGGLIYQDFYSQHTPFAYWFSGLGYALGANGFLTQRLWGYALFALFLTFIYIRNSRRFGRVPLLITVITMVIFHFGNPELSFAVLSDNYQAICYVALVFEFLRLALFRDTSIKPWIVMAVASVVAVGTTFVAIYFVFGVVVASALVSTLNYRAEKITVAQGVRRLALRAGVIAAPFVLVVLFLVVTGTAKDAFDQAYILNTEYYSNYQGGLGSNALAPLIDGVGKTFEHIIGAPQSFVSGTVTGPGEVAGLVAILLTTVGLIRVRPVAGIAFFFIFTLTTVRGWAGFHAQPIWALFATALGVLAWLIFRESLAGIARKIIVGVVALALAWSTAVIAVPYVTTLAASKWETLTHFGGYPNPLRTSVIKTLVPVGEKYGDTGINNVYDFIASNRSPAGGFSGWVPWFTDMLESQWIERLAADNPTLIFHDERSSVWGYNIAEKAPKLEEYIRDNYTKVDMSSLGITEGVYIRNDVLEKSLKKLEKHHFLNGQFVRLPTPPQFPEG